jgi:hypothetical protein
LKKSVKDLNRFLLYCNQLEGQPKTDLWQPVDCGDGKLFKDLVTQLYYHWLDSDENLDRWCGNAGRGRLSAKQRRVLITQWVGKAQEAIMDSKYENT